MKTAITDEISLPPVPHRPAAYFFLLSIFPEIPDGARILIWTFDRSTNEKRSFYYPSVLEAAYAINHLAAPCVDIYFGLGLASNGLSAKQRATAKTVQGISCLWVDIDIAGAGHASRALPISIEEVTHAFNGLLPPSILVNSGGGVHAYWLFNDTWYFTGEDDRLHAATLVQNWQIRIREIWEAHGWTLDKTADLARVLRLPGTTNWKDGSPRPVTLLEELSAKQRYPIETLEASLLKKPAVSLRPIYEGKRNDAVFREGCALQRQGVPDSAIRDKLFNFNSISCKPPLPSFEINSIVNSVTHYPKGDNLPANENPFLREHYTLDKLYSAEEEIDWIVEDVFASGEIGMIYGPSGQFKTFLTLELLGSVSAGATTWCGAYNIPKPRTVLYASEEGIFGTRKRIRGVDISFGMKGLHLDHSRFVINRKEAKLFLENDSCSTSSFIEYCKSVFGDDLGVVALDTFHRASIGADENSNTDAAVILNNARRIQNEIGCTVILVHHTGKNGLVRGASAYQGGLDFMLEVSGNPDLKCGVLKCVKMKDSPLFADKAFKMIPIETPFGDTLVLEWQGDAVTGMTIRQQIAEVMRSEPDKKWTAGELAKQMGRVDQKPVKYVLNSDCMTFCTEFRNPEKPKSPGNPAVYWLAERK